MPRVANKGREGEGEVVDGAFSGAENDKNAPILPAFTTCGIPSLAGPQVSSVMPGEFGSRPRSDR